MHLPCPAPVLRHTECSIPLTSDLHQAVQHGLLLPGQLTHLHLLMISLSSGLHPLLPTVLCNVFPVIAVLLSLLQESSLLAKLASTLFSLLLHLLSLVNSHHHICIGVLSLTEQLEHSHHGAHSRTGALSSLSSTSNQRTSISLLPLCHFRVSMGNGGHWPSCQLVAKPLTNVEQHSMGCNLSSFPWGSAHLS